MLQLFACLGFFALAFTDRTDAAPPVPDSVIWEEGIVYSTPDGESLALNMARPRSDDGKQPAILCIHSGGFRAGKRESYDGLCVKLAEKGFVAATITYRLAPKYQFPAAVHDCKAAVRWLRANAAKYSIDPTKIGITGGSAGGHLAQFLGVTAHVPEFEGTGGNPEQPSQAAVQKHELQSLLLTQKFGQPPSVGRC